jgi:hypothetical protein
MKNIRRLSAGSASCDFGRRSGNAGPDAGQAAGRHEAEVFYIGLGDVFDEIKHRAFAPKASWFPAASRISMGRSRANMSRKRARLVRWV